MEQETTVFLKRRPAPAVALSAQSWSPRPDRL